jgi:hypothetical protein
MCFPIHTCLPMIKFNLYISHARKLTKITNNKVEKYSNVIKVIWVFFLSLSLSLYWSTVFTLFCWTLVTEGIETMDKGELLYSEVPWYLSETFNLSWTKLINWPASFPLILGHIFFLKMSLSFDKYALLPQKMPLLTIWNSVLCSCY